MKGKRKWVLVLGIFAVLLAGVYVGGVLWFQNHFFFNTSVNGLNASGKTVDEMDEMAQNAASQYHIEIRERGGIREYIHGSQIDYHPVPRKEIALLKASQGALSWPFGFLKKQPYTFAYSMAYDEEKLNEAVEELHCMKQMEAPEDAKIEFTGNSCQLVKEKKGTQIDREKLTELLKKVILAGATQVTLEAHGCYVDPAITSEDPALQNQYQGMKHYLNTEVIYTFGKEKEALDGSIIKGWLLTDAEGNVSIDREKTAAYVADLAARRDTYDKSKEFKASDGTWILVSGGSYGWQIDQAAEIEAIFNDLEGSIRETRSPKYARTADSFENCGMGGNYVEVDLTRQHLWMYVDYRLVLQTDFVSGDLAKNHATPSGIYTLYYKESPAVLKSDTPGDSYETPVTYWMPFNGGIGFHDAAWRESFGGVIFQSSGSHGCINMLLDMAALMYENIYAGFPVVCFYR